MSHGVAPSTRRVYSTTQCHFMNFCIQDNQVKPNSILPASQETLIRLYSHVFMSGVRALSILKKDIQTLW